VTSHLYAIADAGGNVYPGTFSKDRITAKCLHIVGGKREWSIPCGTDLSDVNPEYWAPYAERGDHVVYCRIETNEMITLIQVPQP